MNKSLLFLPDISGFTQFIQTTEVLHSQHVISELLEVLLEANTLDLQLAEIEGDALFFFKEEIPSLEKILAQVETLFTAFYSHLKLLEKNRVCPCNACSTAPNLQLKIIAHSGDFQFIEVQGKRKPFGQSVIEAHRLMKNSVPSDNYVLLSQDLSHDLMLAHNYSSKLFNFKSGSDHYDNTTIPYYYSVIETNKLKIKPFAHGKKVHFDHPPALTIAKEYPISAPELLEQITNYNNRHNWVEGVDQFEYNENEVTRIGSEHVCVINGKHLNFVVVTKDKKPGELLYGELTTSPTPVDKLYQFYILSPKTSHTCTLKIETYLEARSIFKKIALFLFVKKLISKNIDKSLGLLYNYIEKKNQSTIH